MSVELKHTGTYHFTASNEGGEVEGTTKLVVHAESEWKEFQSDPAVKSKQVHIGDYVFSFHTQDSSVNFFSDDITIKHMLCVMVATMYKIARNVGNYYQNQSHSIVHV